MKICKRCNLTKSLEQFSKHPRCKDGRQGTCIDCTAANTAKWASNNKIRKAETDRLYEERNPKRKSKARFLANALDPVKYSYLEIEQNLYSRYGISIEEYAYMFYEQEGKCSICKRLHSEFARGLVVDHNHTTGLIRGLLCDNCNRALGFFKDNIDSIVSAISYINQNTNK